MIDDSRGSSNKKSKPKSVTSSIYFSEKRGRAANVRGSSDGKPHGRKGHRKDKGKPRFTAYMLWAKANRNRIIAENPGLDFASISKRLGEVWSSMPMSEKYSWKRKANHLCVKMARQQHFQAQREAAAAAAKKTVRSPPTAAHISSPPSRVVDHVSPAAAAASGNYKVTGTEPLDCAAHLKLLGESLSIIGARLTEHEGQIAVSGSLSVLLDSLLCAVAPLLCLTQQVPELNGIPQENLTEMLDNIAYIMPGL